MADRYCTECGRPLDAQDKFCPGCGAEIKEEPVYDGTATATSYQNSNMNRGGRSDRLHMITVLTTIWGVLGLIAGLSSLYTYIDMDAIVQTMMNTMIDSQSLWDIMVSMGITEDMLKVGSLISGVCYTGSGVMALISGHFCHRQTVFRMAALPMLGSVVFVIVSTVVSAIVLGVFSDILECIIGCIMLYLLNECKAEFAS